MRDERRRMPLFLLRYSEQSGREEMLPLPVFLLRLYESQRTTNPHDNIVNYA